MAGYRDHLLDERRNRTPVEKRSARPATRLAPSSMGFDSEVVALWLQRQTHIYDSVDSDAARGVGGPLLPHSRSLLLDPRAAARRGRQGARAHPRSDSSLRFSGRPPHHHEREVRSPRPRGARLALAKGAWPISATSTSTRRSRSIAISIRRTVKIDEALRSSRRRRTRRPSCRQCSPARSTRLASSARRSGRWRRMPTSSGCTGCSCLVNKAMAADSVDPGDFEHGKEALARAVATVGLARISRAATPPAPARRRYGGAGAHLSRRASRSPCAQDAAGTLVEGGLDPVGLDEPWGTRCARPAPGDGRSILARARRTAGGRHGRHFATLADVARAAAALETVAKNMHAPKRE